jgi:hypothetical protein
VGQWGTLGRSPIVVLLGVVLVDLLAQGIEGDAILTTTKRMHDSGHHRFGFLGGRIDDIAGDSVRGQVDRANLLGGGPEFFGKTVAARARWTYRYGVGIFEISSSGGSHGRPIDLGDCLRLNRGGDDGMARQYLYVGDKPVRTDRGPFACGVNEFFVRNIAVVRVQPRTSPPQLILQ